MTTIDVKAEVGDIVVMVFGQETILGEVTGTGRAFSNDMLDILNIQTGIVAPWYAWRVVANYGKRVR